MAVDECESVGRRARRRAAERKKTQMEKGEVDVAVEEGNGTRAHTSEQDVVEERFQ